MQVTASQVVGMLTANWPTVQHHYPKINAFTEQEVQEFLDGKPGTLLGLSYAPHIGRSWQLNQATSAIGAYLVDAGLASKETVFVYKALWEIQLSTPCKYCRKPFSFKLMFGENGVCRKPRCQLNYMRDSI